MGFTITGSKFITVPYGELESLYGRVDSYHYERNFGTISATIALYKDFRAAKSNQIIEYPVNFSNMGIVGVNLVVSGSGESINYPTRITIPLTSSINVEKPIYTNHITSESISYYDFDDNGDVVEKFKWEYYSQSVQISSEVVQQDIVNNEIMQGNVFPFIYNNVTSEYKKIFGQENVINS